MREREKEREREGEREERERGPHCVCIVREVFICSLRVMVFGVLSICVVLSDSDVDVEASPSAINI